MHPQCAGVDIQVDNLKGHIQLLERQNAQLRDAAKPAALPEQDDTGKNEQQELALSAMQHDNDRLRRQNERLRMQKKQLKLTIDAMAGTFLQ